MNKKNIPKVKVACGALIVQRNRFVCVQLAKNYIRGTWDIPVGKLEPDEDIFSCAIREVKEETGLQIKLKGVLGVYQQKSAIGNNIVKLIFTATTQSTTFVLPKHEIMDARWMTFEECLAMSQKQFRSPDVKHMVRDYFKTGDFDLQYIHSQDFQKRS